MFIVLNSDQYKTFPDEWWTGGWGKVKLKLILAEAKAWALLSLATYSEPEGTGVM